MPSRTKRGVDKKGYPNPAPKRTKVMCQVCIKYMLVAPGQLAKYHKACRKDRTH